MSCQYHDFGSQLLQKDEILEHLEQLVYGQRIHMIDKNLPVWCGYTQVMPLSFLLYLYSNKQMLWERVGEVEEEGLGEVLL